MRGQMIIALVLCTTAIAVGAKGNFEDAKRKPILTRNMQTFLELCSMTSRDFKKCRGLNNAGALLAISYETTCTSTVKRINKCTIKESDMFNLNEPEKAQGSLQSGNSVENTPWFEVAIQESKPHAGVLLCCQVSCYRDAEGLGECVRKGKRQSCEDP